MWKKMFAVKNGPPKVSSRGPNFTKNFFKFQKQTPRGVLQKGVRRNFAKLTGKDLYTRAFFLIKLQAWGLQLY